MSDLLQKTVTERHRIDSYEVLVKREDLCCPPPGPPFSKVRGAMKHFEKLKESGVRIVGYTETSISMAGWCVAWAAQVYGMKAVLFDPQYKDTPEVLTYHRQQWKQFNPVIVPIPAGMAKVNWYRSKRIIHEQYGPEAVLLPLGLPFPETVEETAREAQETLEQVQPASVVINIGSGTIAAGVWKGAEAARAPVRIYAIMGRSGSVPGKLQEIRVKAGVPSDSTTGQAVSEFDLIDPGWKYTEKSSEPCPFPCHPYYDRKAWQWLVENIENVKQPVLFWNIGHHKDLTMKRTKLASNKSQPSSLDPRAEEIKKLYQELNVSFRTTLKLAIQIGEILTQVKKQLEEELGWGHWGRWQKENLEFSDETARFYMQLYEHRDKFQKTWNLTLEDARRILNPAKGKSAKEAQAEYNIEEIFAHAVALDQSGGLKNSIYGIDREVYIMNYDHTVLLHFDVSEEVMPEPFEVPFGFHANDFEGEEFNILENKIEFITRKGGYIKHKTVGTPDLSPEEVAGLFAEYDMIESERHTIMITRQAGYLLDEKLAHVKFQAQAGELPQLIQHDIYGGANISLNPDEEMFTSEAASHPVGPLGIKTKDLKAHFAFADSLLIHLPYENQQEYFIIEALDAKYPFRSIVAASLYDEVIEIRKAKS